MLENLVARTAVGLTHLNTIGVPTVPVRFQIGPGDAGSLGIAGASFTITSNGVLIGAGTTNSDGEVEVPLLVFAAGPVTVRIFDTDYELTLHKGLEPPTTIAGQQKRLDMLGYMTGYLRVGTLTDVPDDGLNGPITQQAIMNFQADHNQDLDGVMGPKSQTALRTAAGI